METTSQRSLDHNCQRKSERKLLIVLVWLTNWFRRQTRFLFPCAPTLGFPARLGNLPLPPQVMRALQLFPSTWLSMRLHMLLSRRPGGGGWGRGVKVVVWMLSVFEWDFWGPEKEPLTFGARNFPTTRQNLATRPAFASWQNYLFSDIQTLRSR